MSTHSPDMHLNSFDNLVTLPAAIRAAFAKFPVSMQAINSLLSSTVFLRTKAGFPFPHFGRLRMVLKAKHKQKHNTKSTFKNIWWHACFDNIDQIHSCLNRQTACSRPVLHYLLLLHLYSAADYRWGGEQIFLPGVSLQTAT